MNATRKTVKPCSVEGCERPHNSKSFCKAHYKRYAKTGEPGAAKIGTKKPDLDGQRERIEAKQSQLFPDPVTAALEWELEKISRRLWAKVQVGSPSECWEWQGSRSLHGYGYMRIGKRACAAHRISYSLAKGHIPEHYEVDHQCYNRACVNPSHLKAVEPYQNRHNLQGAHRDSRTGYRGVSWSEDQKAYKATAQLNGVAHSLGNHPTAERAAEAASAFRREHFENSLMDKESAA